MKTSLLLILSALGCFVMGQTSSPVSVAMISPVSGQVLSNTITLSATATSSAAPIQRVEFYMDGRLIGTVYGSPRPPVNLTARR